MSVPGSLGVGSTHFSSINVVNGSTPPMIVMKEFNACAVKQRKSCIASADAGCDWVMRVRCFTNLASVKGVIEVTPALMGVIHKASSFVNSLLESATLVK